MIDAKTLSGELSLWSAILIGQGKPDAAGLMDRAAATLSRGEQDAGMAASLELYAAVSASNDHASFQALLHKAAGLLAAPAEIGEPAAETP